MYSIEGTLRELPEGAENYTTKKFIFYVDEPTQQKLENIFKGYRKNHPTWSSPLFRNRLKVNVTNLIQKIPKETAQLPRSAWLNRPAKLGFKLRPYRFINQEGIVIQGATVQLTSFEFTVV